ncbi:MAG: hypothetical protein A2511_12225 [Deltaproteobacteria bacterium RIFOXYD12_FULL_50_9]|nr:MAG: hypothetical protein A2511_12225 [Deltaproteobacteria bacterium RIFOXYD12_FULL_50_9]
MLTDKKRLRTKWIVVFLISLGMIPIAYVYGIFSQKNMYFPANVIDECYYIFASRFSLLKPFTDISGKEVVSIGNCRNGPNVMVALVIGQSNAANHASYRTKSYGNVFNYYENGCYVAVDPILGASGSDGSIWPTFGDLVVQSKLFDRVVIVNAAMGGTSVRRWKPGGDMFDRLKKTVKGLSDNGITVTHVFWHQGEADCRYRTGRLQYQERFMNLVGALRDMNVTAPIYVAKVSRNPIPCEQILQAQTDLISAKLGILSGPDADSVLFRFDGVHLNKEGIKATSKLWFDAIADGS